MTSPEGRDGETFVETVAAEAGLGEEEARSLIQAVLESLAEYVDRDAWDLIAAVAPIEVEIDWDDVFRRESPTVRDFLLEESDREEVETARSALHTRIVAETIRNHMSSGEVQRLTQLVDDDFLALFEVEQRGELTEPEGTTPGVEQLEEGDVAEEHPGGEEDRTEREPTEPAPARSRSDLDFEES